jgi:hypothetical protein
MKKKKKNLFNFVTYIERKRRSKYIKMHKISSNSFNFQVIDTSATRYEDRVFDE